MEALANTVRVLSYDHERTSCSGCPERWEPLACAFDEELMRKGSGLTATRCALASPLLGHREPPPALLIQGARSVEAAKEALNKQPMGSRSPPSTDLALQLYSFGADLQRLGSLAAWDQGERARKAALDALEKARPSPGWPAELLSIEASAPSPSRLLGIAIIDTFNSYGELDWRGRAGVARAATYTTPLVRASSADRQRVMMEAAATLEPARTGLAPARLTTRLEQAEALRERTHAVALNALLATHKTCPTSLESLGVSVGTGWSLDPKTCRAQASPSPAPMHPSAARAAGAETASP